MSNPEVSVLTEVLEILAKVDDAAARRIVGWLADKYGVASGMTSTSLVPLRSPVRDAGPRNPESTARYSVDDFATLFADAAPATDRDRALIAGYWFQAVNGETDLDSQALNKALKNLGHGVGNITKALFHLMNQSPALVLQTRKSGGTAQARKRYRLTRAGLAHVEEMLARARG